MHMRPHGGPTHGYMNALCVRNFMLTRHVVWEQAAKVDRNRAYVTMRKTTINKTRLVFQQSYPLSIHQLLF